MENRQEEDRDLHEILNLLSQIDHTGHHIHSELQTQSETLDQISTRIDQTDLIMERTTDQIRNIQSKWTSNLYRGLLLGGLLGATGGGLFLGLTTLKITIGGLTGSTLGGWISTLNHP